MGLKNGRVSSGNWQGSTVQSFAPGSFVLQAVDLSLGGSIILDLQGSTAETELVTNGTFTGSAASWTTDAGFVYSSNTMTLANAGFPKLYQAFGSLLITSVAYKITFQVSTAQAGQTITPHLVDASGAILVSGIAQDASVAGTYTQYLIASGTCQGVGFTHAAVAGGAIDNVSVKAVTTLLFSNPEAGSCYVIKTINGSTPKSNLMINPKPLWAGGFVTDLTTSDNAVDLFSLFYDGANYLASSNNDYK